MLRNLGQICGMLREAFRSEHEMHEDVDVMHAPSECHVDVRRGAAKRNVELVEDVERSTGYGAAELHAEILLRCSHRWLHFYGAGITEVLSDVILAREEAESNRRRLAWRNQSKLPGGDQWRGAHVPHVLASDDGRYEQKADAQARLGTQSFSL